METPKLLNSSDNPTMTAANLQSICDIVWSDDVDEYVAFFEKMQKSQEKKLLKNKKIIINKQHKKTHQVPVRQKIRYPEYQEDKKMSKISLNYDKIVERENKQYKKDKEKVEMILENNGFKYEMEYPFNAKLWCRKNSRYLIGVYLLRNFDSSLVIDIYTVKTGDHYYFQRKRITINDPLLDTIKKMDDYILGKLKTNPTIVKRTPKQQKILREKQ